MVFRGWGVVVEGSRATGGGCGRKWWRKRKAEEKDGDEDDRRREKGTTAVEGWPRTAPSVDEALHCGEKGLLGAGFSNATT